MLARLSTSVLVSWVCSIFYIDLASNLILSINLLAHKIEASLRARIALRMRKSFHTPGRPQPDPNATGGASQSNMEKESSDSMEAVEYERFRTPLLDNCDGYSEPPKYSSVQERCTESTDHSERGEAKIRTYWWRWNTLIVFTLTLAANNVVWITAAPVADVMRCYYGISNTWVNAMTANYMATYVLFFFPVAWFLDRYGLRPTMIVGTLMNALGTSLRVIGAGELVKQNLNTHRSASTLPVCKRPCF